MAVLHLYTQDAAPTFSNTVKGTWNDTTDSADVGGLFNAPSGASTTLAVAEATATNPWDVLLAMFNGAISAQTVQGSVQWMQGVQMSNVAANFVTKVHIWVSVGSTSVVRGTLLNNFVGSTQWPTTGAGLTDGVIKLTPVVASLNDCIVVEIGYRKLGTVATSRTGTLWFGSSASSPDLINGDTNVTGHPGWVEFSNLQLAVGLSIGGVGAS